MNTQKWVIRPYKEGDEFQILDLFELVFDKKRSLEHWRWKFKKNPYSNVNAALAWTVPQERLIGQHTVMPVKLNFRGDSVLACQETDTMVHPDFRGQGISLKTADYCYHELKRSGTNIVFGFPNQNAYPALVRRLQWKRIMYLKEYTFRLNIFQETRLFFRLSFPSKVLNFCFSIFLRSKLHLDLLVLKKRLPKIPTLCYTDSVPEGYGALWNAIKSYEVLSVWKDAEYLKWRYDQNPDDRFVYFYLLFDGEIVGVCVVNAEKGKDVLICELLVKDKDVLLGRLLINQILSHYAGSQHRKARFVGIDAGFFEEVLVAFRSAALFSLPFCARAFGNATLEDWFVHPTNWTVTYGDTDVI